MSTRISFCRLKDALFTVNGSSSLEFARVNDASNIERLRDALSIMKASPTLEVAGVHCASNI